MFLDPEHKFDLAIQLGDLETGYSLATESASEQKWKQLAELATKQAKFDLAQQCLHEAQVRHTNNLIFLLCCHSQSESFLSYNPHLFTLVTIQSESRFE